MRSRSEKSSNVACLVIFATLVTAAHAASPGIEEVYLVHFSHTDYGFTDHPVVCREMQQRYLDIALDAVQRTQHRAPAERFAWTAETIVAVDDWWQAATPARREAFEAAIRSGQLEVAALPHNQTPTLNRREWQTMLHWVPEEVWQRLRPTAAVQNDVNGFPRAGAIALLDRGIRYLFTGINEDSGGVPMPRPSAFWWKMPDGRRMFVYLNYSYPAGYWFFEPVEWRRGPVPRAGDTRFRLPRAGDFMAADEAAVRKAHRHLQGRIRGLEAGGYREPVLVISITNQWRIDNDPPLPLLADFVGAWQRLGLKPELRLTTVSAAMKRLEERVGSRVPEYAGEWTDWWANGAASGPREVAASRAAKRMLAAAESPLWGKPDQGCLGKLDVIYKELCLFDEHTWGSGNSVALPYSLDTLGQFNEKAAMAYRPMARAEWLLSQRVRTRLVQEPEGLHVANSAKLPWSGWVRMPVTCLREDYRSVEDPKTGRRWPIEFENGLRPFTRPSNAQELSLEDSAATFPDNAPRQVARFWLEGIAGRSVRPLRLSTKPAPEAKPSDVRPDVKLDGQAWPASAIWPKMNRPLFLAGIGDFSSVQVRGFAPRWVAKDIWAIGEETQREKARGEKMEHVAASAAGKATLEENAHTLLFSQPLRHPRLRWATRQMELWKREPRARLSVRFYRKASEAPEAFFVAFPLPCEGVMPRVSTGGVPFVPYEDQLPGTCRDYFAIDDWIHYETPAGNWLWGSRDAPLVTFGSAELLARRARPPKDTHRILAMVFNNFWYTNFVADANGVMEFQFDLAWQEKIGDASDLAQALQAEPQVILNPGLKEDPLVIKYLNRP